jgi:hypothetical protein
VSAAPFDGRRAVVERVGRSGFAETVAVTMPDDQPEPGWSLWTEHAWLTGDVRSAFITFESGLFYVGACDGHGHPVHGPLRAGGSPAHPSFLTAVEEFVGRRPNTRLRYGRTD